MASFRIIHTLFISLLTGALFIAAVVPSHSEIIPWSEASLGAHNRVAIALQDKLLKENLHFGSPVFIRIFKQEGELEIWLKEQDTFAHYKTYTICDYSGELGPKLEEGDKQSPEGFYTVTSGQMHPESKYHLAFNLGYPNRYDLTHMRTGSAIMVHGRCSSAGCFAMTDFRMDEIYTLAAAALNNGQQFFSVHIFPFRMNMDNIYQHRESRWLPFWLNLKEGYDLFESTRIPPKVTVDDKRYIFQKPGSDLHAYQKATKNGKS